MEPKLSNRSIRSSKAHITRAQSAKPLARPILRQILGRYMASRGFSIAELAREFVRAEPMEQVELEREGLRATVISDLAHAMAVPRVRMLEMMALPRATMEKKISSQETLKGVANRRALNLLQLLGHTREILEDSTAPEAGNFDAAQWLGRWIETPQPALGGRKPADLLDTEAGTAIVDRALGALRSGSYL
jgi:putative toxin-antitoxin system antitoxin component (TIGR02293 family)